MALYRLHSRLKGGWEHLDIQDGVEWVQEQRRKRRERRWGNSTDS